MLAKYDPRPLDKSNALLCTCNVGNSALRRHQWRRITLARNHTLVVGLFDLLLPEFLMENRRKHINIPNFFLRRKDQACNFCRRQTAETHLAGDHSLLNNVRLADSMT